MNLKFKGIFLSAVSGLVLSASAFAMPVNPTVSMDAFRAPSRSLQAGVNFEGIVALDNCSGSIVRYETSRDTDQAMVFTNGHCNENGMPSPARSRSTSLPIANSRSSIRPPVVRWARCAPRKFSTAR